MKPMTRREAIALTLPPVVIPFALYMVIKALGRILSDEAFAKTWLAVACIALPLIGGALAVVYLYLGKSVWRDVLRLRA